MTTDDHIKAIEAAKSISLRFTSLNEHQVTKAVVPKEEWSPVEMSMRALPCGHHEN